MDDLILYYHLKLILVFSLVCFKDIIIYTKEQHTMTILQEYIFHIIMVETVKEIKSEPEAERYKDLIDLSIFTGQKLCKK